MVGRKPGFKGYWADHRLVKPSVFRDVNRWEGWEAIMQKINTPPGERERDFLALLFSTGARVSEAIQYRAENFVLEGDKILVRGAPLVKNKQLSERWDFYIERSEPQIPRLLSLIERVKESYLFPNRLGSRPYISRQYAWYFIKNELGLYPHWFRAQRAFCLTWYHGLDFEELRAWFTWLDPNTPQHYVRPSPKKIAQKFRRCSPLSPPEGPSSGDSGTQSDGTSPLSLLFP